MIDENLIDTVYGKISYDSSVDILCVSYAGDSVGEYQESVITEEGWIVDVSEFNVPFGVEIINASQVFGVSVDVMKNVINADTEFVMTEDRILYVHIDAVVPGECISRESRAFFDKAKPRHMKLITMAGY